jgi:hypothetical protein
MGILLSQEEKKAQFQARLRNTGEVRAVFMQRFPVLHCQPYLLCIYSGERAIY